MIFSILKSPALHNQMYKSQEKELKIHYYYILCSHVSPRGLGGHHHQISVFGWPLPSAGEGLGLDLEGGPPHGYHLF